MNLLEEDSVVKRIIVGSLLVAVSLAGCKSTTKAEPASVEMTTSTQEVETDNEPNTQQATDQETSEVAEKTEFTSRELEDAVKRLGLRCTMVARTGSHIKKKVCTTSQQRKVFAEASEKWLRDLNRTPKTAGSKPD